MQLDADHSLADQFAAACDWWRDAGVDQDFHDEAEAMLKEPEQQADAPAPLQQNIAPVVEIVKPRIGGDKSDWPNTLESFQQWWMSEATLDDAPAKSRVIPRGSGSAELMIIVPMPEQSDGEALLSGTQGKMIGNMLRAMGIGAEQAYIASALPRHMPMADWSGLQADGLGEVLTHHITLATPKRILVLGQDILTLLGHEKRRGVCDIALADSSIHALASFAPQNLLDNAQLRADLWRRWLEWTGSE